jgi:acid phosphatase type 7
MRKAVLLALAVLVPLLSIVGSATARATFTITPTAGPAGTSVNAQGKGYARRSAYTVTFGSTVVRTGTTGSAGGFRGRFLVPSGYSGPTPVTGTVAGVSRSASFNVTTTADTTPPDTTITSGPSGTVRSTSASFSFTSTESGSTFECRLDGGTFGACSSPKAYASLADGSHTFAVRATDAAGNTDATPATRTWTVQTSTQAQYPLRGMFFRQSNGGFDVEVSKGFNLIDSSPGEVDSLPSGVKGFTWIGDYNKTTCQWDNSDAQIRTWVSAHIGDPKVGVWTLGDEPWIGGTPHCASAPQQFKDRTALIHSIDPNAKTLMIIDSNSGQESLDQLAAWKGATDWQALNPYMCWQGQACRYQWIDTLAQAADAAGLNYWGVVQAYGEPDTSGQELCDVESGIEHCGAARLPTATEIHDEFTHWRATHMLAYLVFSWRWPDSTPSLWLENHPELQDQLSIENSASPTPAPPDTTPPDTSITAGPSGTTSSTSASFSFTSTESGSTFECQLDSGTWGTCTSPKAYSSLADGSLTFSVRATDQAGNTDTTPATRTWTIDTSAPPPTDPVITAAGDLCGNTTNCTPTANLVLSIKPTAALTLGDNAYEDGSLTEYTTNYHPQWGQFKGITKPTTGNHEFHTSGAAGYHSYFGIQPDYYSYDLGNWHLIALGSDAGIDNASGGAEETWLKADLAATTKPCTLAYWHEPRFTSGSVHSNDTSVGPFWSDLYAAGADLVINGHNHQYERFAPQDPTGKADPARGIREFVAGTGGAGLYSFASPQPNSEVRDDTSHGVLRLTLHPGSYGWQFVPIAGDSFADSGTASCH